MKYDHAKWMEEFAAARSKFKPFHTQGDRVVKKYLSEDSQDTLGVETRTLNLFHSNVVTVKSMMYGNMPKIEVDRRFNDANDDVARVAGEILSRILNVDIQDDDGTFSEALRACLEDRLITGLGIARQKYDFKTEQRVTPAIVDPMGVELAPQVTEEYKADEWVDTIYVHWKDVMWSPARTYAEIRWIAYRSYMTKYELAERFGEKIANAIPLSENKTKTEEKEANPQAEVWEIWCKDSKKVYWLCECYPQLLEESDPPLELDCFFPSPIPLIANCTTSQYIPKSDYVLSQDIYNEIDELQTRISLLTRAIKVVGVYDKSSAEVKRVFNEGVENDLIPVENWAKLSEKGGLAGVIDWIPIDSIVKAVDVLTVKLNEKIQQLYQVTGMSDVMRGVSTPYATAAEQKIKAQFASTRIQAMQDDFARFASDLQSIKVQIIAKYYSPEQIIRQSNIMSTPDAQYAQQAVALIKDPSKSRWRITVRPESLAISDYAQLQNERTEYINALSMFLQSAAPVVQQAPQASAFLVELLKWGLAGFRGSRQIEGVVDRAIDMLQKNPPQQKEEDPNAQIKAQAEQIKAQATIQKIQLEMQRDQQEHQMKMVELQLSHKIKMTELQAKIQADERRAVMEAAFGQQEMEHEKEMALESRFEQAGRSNN
jgi:hypothetical protein